ncbi:hypothetical protein BC937DRAFT_91462 [Endogone sp. FLAS-F59071]|nr:hypothetical protein BC937DRAFT_91462 [Endogone sp. FLAS-F59071]|eukprot:RUS21788.1 hypothetical protein BC937DRAFT_91462 [Endogone sp. FLAS-F59071]
MDRLFKEERFKAYQKHRGLDAMDTSDDNEETQQEVCRSPIACPPICLATPCPLPQLINQIVTSEYQSHLALASQNPAYAQLLVQQGFPPFSQQPQELVQAVVQQIGQDVSLGQVAGYVDPGLAFAHGPEQPTSVIQQQWQPSGTMGAVPGSYVGPQWNQWRESN